MSSALRVSPYCVALAVMLFATSAVTASKTPETVPRAPIPAQIPSGKSAFISYAGIDNRFLPAYVLDHTGAPNGLYDEFYAAMKSWGRYDLVSAPADADLIFEISLSQHPPQDPHFLLHILDPRTHAILWTIFENVPAGSGREATRRKNWDQALTQVVDDVKALAAQPTGTASNK